VTVSLAHALAAHDIHRPYLPLSPNLCAVELVGSREVHCEMPIITNLWLLVRVRSQPHMRLEIVRNDELNWVL
jgi:hypothetical protein